MTRWSGRHPTHHCRIHGPEHCFATPVGSKDREIQHWCSGGLGSMVTWREKNSEIEGIERKGKKWNGEWVRVRHGRETRVEPKIEVAI